MGMKLMLASDTTVLAVRAVVYLFFIGMTVGTLPGLFSLAVYFFKRERSHWRIAAVILGLLSVGAGVAGLLFVGFGGSWDFVGWAVASTPLIIGICAIVIWAAGVKNAKTVV